MYRVEGSELTVVHNLADGTKLVYAGLAPDVAVCCAHAQSAKRAGDLPRAREVFGHLLRNGERTVSCGDFSALTQEAKAALLAAKEERGRDAAARTGRPVVYDYAADAFRADG